VSRYTAARVGRQFTRGSDLTDWRMLASCVDLTIAEVDAIFYPSYPDRAEEIDRANYWCDACPVAAQCLATALGDVAGRSAGIYAGTGPAQRQALHRAQQQTRRETDQLVARLEELRRRGTA
jgi:predicted nucleotide-binding protein (sugar kinase/HSP70/actin superfamily)